MAGTAAILRGALSPVRIEGGKLRLTRRLLGVHANEICNESRRACRVIKGAEFFAAMGIRRRDLKEETA